MSARGSERTARGGARAATPQDRGTSLPVRALWFVLVGWWLAAVWTAATWFAFVSVVGAPVGLKLLNGLPTVRSLKDRGLLPPSAFDPVRRPAQEPIVVRAVYFLLVGWWLGALWALVGYALTLTVVATPFGSRMLAKLPYVVSLFRY